MFCIEELFPQFFSETWNYFLDFGFIARNLLIIMDFVVCVVLRRPAHRRTVETQNFASLHPQTLQINCFGCVGIAHVETI